MGTREAGDEFGAGGAPADLRLGLDFRHLRPRDAAPRPRRRYRDLRPGDGQMRPGDGRARLPKGRLAYQGVGRGHLRDDRQRRDALRGRQTHWCPSRPRAAQQLLARQPRIRNTFPSTVVLAGLDPAKMFSETRFTTPSGTWVRVSQCSERWRTWVGSTA